MAGLIAWRLARGLRRCSANTGAYCQARAKIPERVCPELMRRTGRQTQEQAPADWRWLGHRVLDVDSLTQWMAGWAGLDYVHIDPLKTNFAAVTEVMSSAYAARFGILPVEVKPHQVVIATAEPFMREAVGGADHLLFFAFREHHALR